ncbi:uncharacterized protein MELLADRAFT_70106 [Melampsora larici-populina 98AG31]|uniref:Uncharacterized protein n=1 Tax=Melampsora larici-populina (strain 98AG31 / pathotype 3-4-7) TaxID=747676 RepID=F4SDL3_MELLP|nr:uncharacterized protein MELLADRAFT_70106 [Melampsora larici-populina 98AG31]EGF97263.1 hypothetical protein MELLADRAFT_70106 [Melampsora larici-populina 98AG31]
MTRRTHYTNHKVHIRFIRTPSSNSNFQLDHQLQEFQNIHPLPSSTNPTIHPLSSSNNLQTKQSSTNIFSFPTNRLIARSLGYSQDLNRIQQSGPASSRSSQSSSGAPGDIQQELAPGSKNISIRIPPVPSDAREECPDTPTPGNRASVRDEESVTAEQLNTRSKAGTNKMVSSVSLKLNPAKKRLTPLIIFVNQAGRQERQFETHPGQHRRYPDGLDAGITKEHSCPKWRRRHPPGTVEVALSGLMRLTDVFASHEQVPGASTGMSPRAMSLGVDGDDDMGSLKAGAAKAAGDDERGNQSSKEGSGRDGSNSEEEDEEAPGEEEASPPAVQPREANEVRVAFFEPMRPDVLCFSNAD